METDEKITIIEGPPPTFDIVHDGWALSLNESPSLAEVAVTRLRTFNGPELIERCHRAWHKQHGISLEYRGSDGLKKEAPIIAARYVDAEDGQLLILWVRLAEGEVEIELGYEDDPGDEDDDQGI